MRLVHFTSLSISEIHFLFLISCMFPLILITIFKRPQSRKRKMRREMENELCSFVSRSHLESLRDEEKERESRPQSDPDLFPVVQLKVVFRFTSLPCLPGRTHIRPTSFQETVPNFEEMVNTHHQIGNQFVSILSPLLAFLGRERPYNSSSRLTGRVNKILGYVTGERQRVQYSLSS